MLPCRLLIALLLCACVCYASSTSLECVTVKRNGNPKPREVCERVMCDTWEFLCRSLSPVSLSFCPLVHTIAGLPLAHLGSVSATRTSAAGESQKGFWLAIENTDGDAPHIVHLVVTAEHEMVQLLYVYTTLGTITSQKRRERKRFHQREETHCRFYKIHFTLKHL